MKIRHFIYILVSFVLAISNLLIAQNIITTVVVLILSLVIFFVIYERDYTKYKRNLSRSYEAINYMNNFIISLSVNPSLVHAFENARNSASSELKLQIDSLKHLTIEEQIAYLYRYFELPIYGVFVNVIKQYVFNGGDILDISQTLMRDSRELEDRLLNYEKMSRRAFFEFITSRALTFVILFILQFSISTIYKSIATIANYPVLILIFYLIFSMVFILMIYRTYDITFMTKGDSYVKEAKAKNAKTKSRSKKRIFKARNR